MPETVPTSPTPPRRSALRLLGGAIAVTTATITGCTRHPERAARPANPGPAARPAGGGTVAPGPRVEELVRELTLDEKVSLLHGATDPRSLGEAGYVPGVPRLGIPALRLADGPAGVRVTAHATALPAPVLLASAFDPQLARRYGQVIGHEGRALGQDVLLSPMVNLIRTPYAGRNFETFSEDPLLASDLVAAEIDGIQSEGLVATVKHYAMNNQEKDRMSVDVRIDEQTMRETELRGFEAAVRAGSGAVMAAYNKVDGTFAAENKELLTDILRDQWHFGGWVMSDWGATHSTGPALAAGLDMEMPGGDHFGDALAGAVRDGTVPEAQVDRSVRRLLTVLDRFGLLGGAQPARPARDAAKGAAVAREVALAGATLLRNERHTLPLTGGDIAVIGPTGAVPFVSGGGSAHVVPERAESPLDAIRARARRGRGAAKVTYALGEDVYGKRIPAGSIESGGGGFDTEKQHVAAGDTWTCRGTLTVGKADAGEWTLVIHYSGRTRPKVLLDGTDLFPVLPGPAEFFTGGLTSTAPDGLSVRHGTARLTAGRHTLEITAEGGDQGQVFRLRRMTRATRAADTAEAVRAARAARHVVLFAYEDATEGTDRTTLALPGSQNALIDAVTRANPRTTVVLNTSSSTSMPWLERTGAVLQMYYPGQEGAAATTGILFGDHDPGGRLTQTFPVDDDHHPVAGDRRRYPGTGGTEVYSEGIHVGYRWYAAKKARPLFPFGHGLSYTTFTYSEPSARWSGGSHGQGDGLEVSFSVRNTGRREGVAVPQVYVGPAPGLGLDQATRVLGGYRRLTLRPGERRRVTVTVTRRTLSSWDVRKAGDKKAGDKGEEGGKGARGEWVLGTGRRTVWVGPSAGDLPLRTTAEVRA